MEKTLNRIIFFLLLLPSISNANTVLCVAEAGAVVEDGGDQIASAHIADVSSKKYIQTEQDGKLIIKELGSEFPIFNSCSSEYFCERSSGYAGVFIRSKEGTFSIVWYTKLNDRNQLVTAKGRCSKL